jgi:hypothetical protein
VETIVQPKYWQNGFTLALTNAESIRVLQKSLQLAIRKIADDMEVAKFYITRFLARSSSG